MRDTLFLIEPELADLGRRRGEAPPEPGHRDPCCAALEGLLARYPKLATELVVVRVPYARSSCATVEAVGEARQRLPALVFADDAPDIDAVGRPAGARVVDGHDAVMCVLSRRHGVPYLHA